MAIPTKIACPEDTMCIAILSSKMEKQVKSGKKDE